MINLPHSLSITFQNAPVALPVAPQALSITPYPSDADIVPDEVQNRLLYWRDIFKLGQFDIGDQVAKVIMYNAEKGMQITHKRIFQAISTFCGKTPRTVRYYYETAVFYPTEVRQQYDALPFSHFVEARMFGDSWQDYLETALLYPHRSPENVRNIYLAPFVSQNLTSLPPVAVSPVAVGVAVGVGADVSNLGVSNLERNIEPGEESKKNICEVSQELGGDGETTRGEMCEVSQVYSQHAAICRVDAALTAVQDVIPIIDQAILRQDDRKDLLAACGELLRLLPKVGIYFAHAEGMV